MDTETFYDLIVPIIKGALRDYSDAYATLVASGWLKTQEGLLYAENKAIVEYLGRDVDRDWANVPVVAGINILIQQIGGTYLVRYKHKNGFFFSFQGHSTYEKIKKAYDANR